MLDDHGGTESGSYPARLDIEYPEEGLGRASTAFRILEWSCVDLHRPRST